MHFTEYDTRLAAYALITNDAGEILLSWFNGSVSGSEPTWTMPGGGIEFDETLHDGVVREVYEETGYHVEVGPIIAEDHFTLERSVLSHKPFRSQRFVLAATVVGGELGTTEVDGTTDYARWIPIADLPGLPHAGIIDVALAAGPQRAVA
ncbi:hypothetical protein GCM10028820_06490 [Tessaracoccus terricola]